MKKLKHLKKFEAFDIESDIENKNESIFRRKDKDSGKSAYKNVADFIEGDSEEAKKIKSYYDKYIKGLSDSEIKNSPRAKGVMKQITSLGQKWARENKMAQPKDFSFKQIRTVLEGDYERGFKGGTDVTIGESKKENN